MTIKGKNMRGFMCHSPAATAVCITSDPRSVIVPRRPNKTLIHHAKLINAAKYTRIVESRRYPPLNKRQVLSPSLKRDRDLPVREKKPNEIASAITTSDLSSRLVVVMRVSLHCQGCADKVKKHLSKMEGVTSFSIDLETKRVTVMGHVSPVGVLESTSKVKKAEFWPC
ncbi:Heavy metal-associated domain, HMA [Dillenia turbinata]|uniref:Heavy metal-associated domain, HMA n=1 Tax=Dillenia turbinata TaxID=194707 RepID=A0AAN8W3T7_9MAGN